MKRKQYCAEKGAQLMQAKRLVLHRFGIGEEEWIDCMIETGCRFVENFAILFPDQDEIKAMILQGKPDEGDPNNSFWLWWRFKWSLDDEAIIKSSLYYKDHTYMTIKKAMIGDDLLEAELLQSLQTKLQL